MIPTMIAHCGMYRLVTRNVVGPMGTIWVSSK